MKKEEIKKLILILIFIMPFLLLQKLLFLSSIILLLISVIIFRINSKKIIYNIKNFWTERKNIKNLIYYKIIDDNKDIDLEKRKKYLVFLVI